MSESKDRIAALKAASAAAKKQGPVRESLSLPEDRAWDSPFSGVRLKDVFASRKAASDKLENLREEETEALQQREAKGKKMAKGGVTRADGCVTKGHTKGRLV
jgi:hypothetical protein